MYKTKCFNFYIKYGISIFLIKVFPPNLAKQNQPHKISIRFFPLQVFPLGSLVFGSSYRVLCQFEIFHILSSACCGVSQCEPMIVRYRDQWSMWPAAGWTWTESTSIQIGCRKDAQELIEGMIQPWKVASSQYLRASLSCF